MEENSEAINSLEPNNFESLRDVEFAGKQGEETPEEAKESLSLDEKVARLRAPFEADEAIRVAHVDEMCHLQTEFDSRNEEIEEIRKARNELIAAKDTLAGDYEEQAGKFSSRFRKRFHLADEKISSINSRRAAAEKQILALGARKEKLEGQNNFTQYEAEQLQREPDYEESPEPLTVEEKEQLLSPEALSELSLEEYLALWRRLNPFYASHVTRQGVRDHFSMVYHTGGLGEVHNGFTETLRQEKSIHSPAEVRYGLSSDFGEEEVQHLLDSELETFEDYVDERLRDGDDPESVAAGFVDMLGVNRSLAAADPWSDRAAIHFARNTVLDDTYGAEKGNEVFYVFPIDALASQYRFGGHAGAGFSTANVVSERKWNDLFVWTESGRIPLDSGIVFLPKSTQVSPETGSVYETTESVGPDGETVREPFLDEEIVQSLTRAIETLEEEGFYDENFYSIIGDRERRDALAERLETEFGLEPELVDSIVSGRNQALISTKPSKFAEDYTIVSLAESDGFDLSSLDEKEKFRILLRYAMETNTIGFKKAENTISAEAFWRQYFEEHPEERPKHVVFYDGNPSDAVDELLERHHIAENVRTGSARSDYAPNMTGPGDTHEKDGKWLGFDSHHVINPEEDEEFQREHDRFNEIAIRLATEMMRKRKAEMSGEDA